MKSAEISIITHKGGIYKVPDVAEVPFRAVIVPILQHPGDMDTLNIATLDTAMLSIPIKAIRSVFVGAEEVWRCNASTAKRV